MKFDFETELDPRANFGLIVLQSDETIEEDLHKLLPKEARLYASRIACAPDVTNETLAMMEGDLEQSATLLPPNMDFSAIGYGCTSGTAAIGQARIAELIQKPCKGANVSEPVSALLAACQHLNIRNLGFLSPYVADVSQNLRDVLARAEIETPCFGSFHEGRDPVVAKIAPKSIQEAALELGRSGKMDALFISCTNLRCLDVIPTLEAELDMPVLSSNLVLGWHMARIAGLTPNAGYSCKLLEK